MNKTQRTSHTHLQFAPANSQTQNYKRDSTLAKEKNFKIFLSGNKKQIQHNMNIQTN